MQIKNNLLNKNTTANRVSSRGNPVNLSLQPSLHLCKAPFGDRTNKNSIVNRGSPICVRKRNPADCHHLFVWFCLWDSKSVFIIWFSKGSFGQPCLMGKSSIDWQFSMAMLNNQRVSDAGNERKTWFPMDFPTAISMSSGMPTFMPCYAASCRLRMRMVRTSRRMFLKSSRLLGLNFHMSCIDDCWAHNPYQ